MNPVSGTYYIWIGGSCDYGHKERSGAAAAVIELDGKVTDRKLISDLHSTEFRMILTLMVQLMDELPEGSGSLTWKNWNIRSNAILSFHSFLN